MLRIARALLIAAALALPGAASAQEPRALTDSERAMRNLALGLAALAALGLALRAADDDEEEDAGRPEEPPPRRLPAACLVEWPVRDGTVRLYDPDCLEERFARASELPLDCAVTVRSRGRFVSGFDPHCLRESGWRVAGY